MGNSSSSEFSSRATGGREHLGRRLVPRGAYDHPGHHEQGRRVAECLRHGLPSGHDAVAGAILENLGPEERLARWCAQHVARLVLHGHHGPVGGEEPLAGAFDVDEAIHGFHDRAVGHARRAAGECEAADQQDSPRHGGSEGRLFSKGSFLGLRKAKAAEASRALRQCIRERGRRSRRGRCGAAPSHPSGDSSASS